VRLFWKIIVISVDIQWRVTDWSAADEQMNNVRRKLYIVELHITYFLRSHFKLLSSKYSRN
jgi:hypothetical protein